MGIFVHILSSRKNMRLIRFEIFSDANKYEGIFTANLSNLETELFFDICTTTEYFDRNLPILPFEKIKDVNTFSYFTPHGYKTMKKQIKILIGKFKACGYKTRCKIINIKVNKNKKVIYKDEYQVALIA